MNQVTIAASHGDTGMRLDLFLAKKLPEFSRAQMSKLIKAGHVRTLNKPTKPSQPVLGNETFFFTPPEKRAGILMPQAIPLEVIFSDKHLAVINKPTSLVVHPGGGVLDNTLCNALLYHFPDMEIGNTERPGIVHRLDKETSGLMVVAKTHHAHQKLSDDFKYRRVTKIYRAFCFGEFAESKFELITGHVRHPYNRLKFFTKLSPRRTFSKNVRMAHTSFEVIRSAFGISELKATLHTGRTHQIRAHLSDIDHPLLGDELYGGKRSLAKSTPKELLEVISHLSGQALHAESLAFLHPETLKPLSFTAALPSSLSIISESLYGRIVCH